jgi:16S rRNA processing protein RimM
VNLPAEFQIGYITRARGLNGQVVVRTFDPASQALEEVDRVLLLLADGSRRGLQIQERSAHGGECVLTLEGIADRTAADGLVGSTVVVFREDLEPPAEGEYFQGDLIGLEAVDEAGSSLGKVEEIWNTGPVPNLVIRGPDRPELLVPFVDDFVRTVDLAAGRVVLRPPELLE